MAGATSQDHLFWFQDIVFTTLLQLETSLLSSSCTALGFSSYLAYQTQAPEVGPESSTQTPKLYTVSLALVS